MSKEKINKLMDNLNQRKINSYYAETFEEAVDEILNLIPKDSLVGIGNSVTLKRMDITNILTKRGNKVLDKTMAKTKEEVRELKRKSLLTDWYITGTNAISIDGHIINVDHSGNRVAAMIYGPDKVIIVVGENKITNSLEEAIYRVKNIASPKNAKRAGFNPPCVELGRCVDCKSPDRVCNSLVIIEGQHDKDRMIVIIVGEEEGF
ncbi:lactate utilization protein [Clostridium malenominatum]